MSKRRMHWVTILFCLLGSVFLGGCRSQGAGAKLDRAETFAELRAVKGSLTVIPPGGKERQVYPRERLTDGQQVLVKAGGLAWMRRDGGTTWLISGPARLTLHPTRIEMAEGRAFVDSELGQPASVETPKGGFELSDARVSLEIGHDGAASAYVLRGTARAGGAERASAGEMLTLLGDGKVERRPVLAWQDWTGGLGTADPAAEPAPYGIGTVGARRPGDSGKPRFSLVIQRLDVKVSIDKDFALTEVDQTFVNPSSDTVEGLFTFRTPATAVLQRFGVDREGDLIWGRIKESAEAVRQYESNVYAGSEEDPALLTWQGAGVFGARLYPIRAGSTRRVVTRYSEWLTRQGPRGERRLYVYPMAAEGAKGSLPRIEELTVTLDLAKAGALSVRSGMGGKRQGNKVVVRAFDFVPRADLAVELFDNGSGGPIAYRASHDLLPDEAPESGGADFAKTVSKEEPDYIAVPLRAPALPGEAESGIDLAVVIDTSAATEPSALAIARTIASSLLTHLGPRDRAALWAGDATLRPVVEGSGALGQVDDAKRKQWLGGLAAVERGGATDIGAILTQAASVLDPRRPGAVVYVGDGAPSVGEFMPKALGERLARLPSGTRILAAAVGSRPNLALLESVVRGAPVEQVYDAYGAARSALRLLEAASRPMWLAAKIDLGSGVERVMPKVLPPVAADETVMVVGRVTGALPAEIELRGSGGVVRQRLSVRRLADGGDLRRRWGDARMQELIGEGAGRASLVDVGRRFGVVSPVTSLYVPTTRESAQETEHPELAYEQWVSRLKRWKPWAMGGLGLRDSVMSKSAEAPVPMASAWSEPQIAESNADNKEGGTGTRAKGEEGSMGNPNSKATTKRYAVQGPSDVPERPSARSAAMAEAREFGMIGLLNSGEGSSGKPAAVREREARVAARAAPELQAQSAPEPTVTAAPAAPPSAPSNDAQGNLWRDSVADAPGVAGLGLSSIGTTGGGKGATSALASASPDSGQGFGSGHGRLGASGDVAVPKVRMGRANAQSSTGDLDPMSRSRALRIGGIGHERAPCGPGADLPLSERLVLWRERLATQRTLDVALHVYRQALRDCEASDWRERSALLVQIVDNLGSVRDRVALWRALLTVSPTAADAVYRFLLLRVQTSQDLKELHDALGFERIEPELLDALLKKGRNAAERLALLRGAAEKFADDTELALRVLDAYEDAGDDAGGRAWARKLRRRVDATAHIRTNVGEYYLRLASRATGVQAQRDAEEARRTFGELVEFAPEDPLARRRLGDLLRAHGWYEDAMRQYETLATLTPDDPSVPLLLAAAAQGTGKVEEAVRWAEKAAATGSPDAASPISTAARALASAFLVWARQDSAKAGNKDEVERLRTRAARLAASEPGQSVRAVLSWAHPELRPALWTNALGSMMPAPDNLPLLGVAQAFVPGSPAPEFEVRLDPEDAARAARLGVKATLTVVSGEGTATERTARVEVGFGGLREKPRQTVRVRFDGATLVVEESR